MNTTHTRREFLKGAFVGSVGAALAIASRKAHATPKTTPTAAPAAPTSQGYHLTPHIREYYKTAAL
jgi:hypothetical protein